MVDDASCVFLYLLSGASFEEVATKIWDSIFKNTMLAKKVGFSLHALYPNLVRMS